MFGIIYALFVGGVYSIGKIMGGIEDIQSKNDAIQNRSIGKNTANLYRDHRGVYRDIKSGKPRILFYDDNGDACLSDINGNTVKNLSEEKREREWRAKITDENVRAVKYDFWGYTNSKVETPYKEKVLGDIYKDVSTGELYVVRRFITWNPDTNMLPKVGETRCKAHFYMRVSDATLVDVTDEYKKNPLDERYGKVPTRKEIDDFIQFFNEKQKQVGGWLNCRYEIQEGTFWADRDKYLKQYQ